MEQNELINLIYNRTINIILNGIEEQYKDEIKIAYKDYVDKKYSSYNLEGVKKEDVYKFFVDLEVSKWEDISIGNKLSELLKDEALENIRYISNIGFEYAEARINQRKPGDNNSYLPATLDETISAQNIDILNNLLSKVRSFNQNLANSFVSEGIIDFKYASGKTENTSLRIGRIR